MNRAMVVTALHRLDGEKKYKNIINFIDVSKDAYYEKALYWAAEKKIITGTSENTFSPELNVTREQLVTILYRYADYKNKSISVGKQTDLSKFQDFEEISEYAVVPMKWAYSKGIINGRTENEIAPKGTATRAEVATIIMRFNKKIK